MRRRGFIGALAAAAVAVAVPAGPAKATECEVCRGLGEVCVGVDADDWLGGQTHIIYFFPCPECRPAEWVEQLEAANGELRRAMLIHQDKTGMYAIYDRDSNPVSMFRPDGLCVYSAMGTGRGE